MTGQFEFWFLLLLETVVCWVLFTATKPFLTPATYYYTPNTEYVRERRREK